MRRTPARSGVAGLNASFRSFRDERFFKPIPKFGIVLVVVLVLDNADV